jgi:hypothetical protein
MVKYQSMLCESLRIQMEVVRTPNLVTLLPVDSGPPEHDCLVVMDEVFSSWADPTDQPISRLDICLVRLALPVMWW